MATAPLTLAEIQALRERLDAALLTFQGEIGAVMRPLSNFVYGQKLSDHPPEMRAHLKHCADVCSKLASVFGHVWLVGEK